MQGASGGVAKTVPVLPVRDAAFDLLPLDFRSGECVTFLSLAITCPARIVQF